MCVGIHRKRSESIRPGKKLAGYPELRVGRLLSATVRDLRSCVLSAVLGPETQKGAEEPALTYLLPTGSCF
jgi:hypothetical protein